MPIINGQIPYLWCVSKPSQNTGLGKKNNHSTGPCWHIGWGGCEQYYKYQYAVHEVGPALGLVASAGMKDCCKSLT